MRYLLDTHVLLWWWGEPELLSAAAFSLIEQPDHEILVSSATAWELATKVRLGKLPGAKAAVRHYEAWLDEAGFSPLPITSRHALKAGSLIAEHRDPFDRMLVAQALLEDLEVITRDSALSDLGARTRW